MNHKMKVYLVVFARKALQLFNSLIDDIQIFIDENYVDAAENTYNRNFECREEMSETEAHFMTEGVWVGIF